MNEGQQFQCSNASVLYTYVGYYIVELHQQTNYLHNTYFLWLVKLLFDVSRD